MFTLHVQPKTMHLCETILVDNVNIACDGDKASGHPRVYLTMAKNGSVDCPYCGKHYVLKEGIHDSSAH